MTEKREKERVEDLTLDRETFETAVREIWRAEPPPKKNTEKALDRKESGAPDNGQRAETT